MYVLVISTEWLVNQPFRKQAVSNFAKNNYMKEMFKTLTSKIFVLKIPNSKPTFAERLKKLQYSDTTHHPSPALKGQLLYCSSTTKPRIQFKDQLTHVQGAWQAFEEVFAWLECLFNYFSNRPLRRKWRGWRWWSLLCIPSTPLHIRKISSSL